MHPLPRTSKDDVYHRAVFRFDQSLVGVLYSATAQYVRHPFRDITARVNRAYLASGGNLEVQMFASGIVVALTHGVLLCLFAAIAQMFVALGGGDSFRHLNVKNLFCICHTANPYYTNRDPRFYLTIAKNGDEKWPNWNTVPLQTYQGGLNAEPLSGGTPTGYYLKKYCQTAVDLRAGTASKTYHSWITFRFGEFYLNYAEAVYKYLGSPYATDNEFTTSAVDAIKVVRTRAEMPGFPQGMTNDAFWKKYQNERMVELAFEEHRFRDVRRWKEGDKHFKNIVEMKITKNGDDTYTYERKVKERSWDDKMYFFPIPQSEKSKNPNLEQNPGW